MKLIASYMGLLLKIALDGCKVDEISNWLQLGIHEIKYTFWIDGQKMMSNE